MKFSVIFPLFELRGDTLRYLKSFAQEQTLPRSEYEVVVVSDGADPTLEERLQSVLLPTDQLVVEPQGNRAQLCNAGARHGRGDFIFLTESHCLAAPDCLEQMVRFLDEHDVHGASVSSHDGCLTTFAKVEAERFNELNETWRSPGDWRKVMIRGFAFPRLLWQELGGLDERFPKLAEWLFAARLHDRGIRIGVATKAFVTHFYNTSFENLRAFTKKYAVEDCACRLSEGEVFCNQYLGKREDWSEREEYRRQFSRSLCYTSLRSLAPALSQGRGSDMAGELAYYLPRALWGAKSKTAAEWLRVRFAALRCWLWQNNPDRLRSAYVDACSALESYYRLQFISEVVSAPYSELTQTLDYPIEQLLERQLLGAHDLEQWNGLPFRWLRPVAAILLNVPRGNYELELDAGGLMPQPLPGVQSLRFNRSQIDQRQLTQREHRVFAPIRAEMFCDEGPQTLTIVSAARAVFPSMDDPRPLGLPVFSLRFAESLS